jgi:hypothetical protein
VLEVRPREQKERLFGYKQQTWSGFGYSQLFLDGMRSQTFWDAEYERIPAIDQELQKRRAG